MLDWRKTQQTTGICSSSNRSRADTNSPKYTRKTFTTRSVSSFINMSTNHIGAAIRSIYGPAPGRPRCTRWACISKRQCNYVPPLLLLAVLGKPSCVLRSSMSSLSSRIVSITRFASLVTTLSSVDAPTTVPTFSSLYKITASGTISPYSSVSALVFQSSS